MTTNIEAEPGSQSILANFSDNTTGPESPNKTKNAKTLSRKLLDIGDNMVITLQKTNWMEPPTPYESEALIEDSGKRRGFYNTGYTTQKPSISLPKYPDNPRRRAPQIPQMVPATIGTRHVHSQYETGVKRYSTSVKSSMASLVHKKVGLNLEQLLMSPMAAVARTVARCYSEPSHATEGKEDHFRCRTRAPTFPLTEQNQNNKYLLITLNTVEKENVANEEEPVALPKILSPAKVKIDPDKEKYVKLAKTVETFNLYRDACSGDLEIEPIVLTKWL